MTQASMTIPDSSGAVLLTNVSNALAALASNNAGATAPTPTYPDMLWADTSTGLMKQRDNANAAWIVKGLLADYGMDIKSIVSSVGSNALTLTLNPTVLGFRANSLTSGLVNTRAVPSAISMVVPSGATLGTVNGQFARLALLAIDNAGTIEPAVVNLAGGLNLDETTLINTTAITSGATSANVIYSTTARTGVPFRVVGFVDVTEATAGTWATAPSTIQGAGGQALAALSSLGYGQTWQATGKYFATTYYNTTGKPQSIAYKTTSGVGSSSLSGVSVAGVAIGAHYFPAFAGDNHSFWASFIVPPGASWSITGTMASGTIYELK